MSRFNTVVPVPLGEARRIEGALGATAKAGLLLTAGSSFSAGDGTTHVQSDGAAFTLNATGNTKGVLILMEETDQVTAEITADRASGSWGKGHVLKSGEEVTVVLSAAAAVTGGSSLLKPAASGTVAVTATASEAMFSAIESASTASTGDQLRILARVL